MPQGAIRTNGKPPHCLLVCQVNTLRLMQRAASIKTACMRLLGVRAEDVNFEPLENVLGEAGGDLPKGGAKASAVDAPPACQRYSCRLRLACAVFCSIWNP